MPRAKFQTLTEQMFYILLCLKEECCGMDIMDRVPAMTDGRVNVGSGTLYNLLEQFQEAGMIRLTKAEGRRRSYVLTDRGRETLAGEYRRIRCQMADYCTIFGEEEA
ncbi:MAG: PadR family transcriptional regulator [Oscillospiraceae bacterium]|nr:PadR family transcriptional regulator [Oscillospiraceae bacterium]